MDNQDIIFGSVILTAMLVMGIYIGNEMAYEKFKAGDCYITADKFIACK